MNSVLCEDNLVFDFSMCGKAEKYDVRQTNPHGMLPVDFVAESDDTLYFVEVKDYQNPRSQRREKDLALLKEVMRTKGHIYSLRIGTKLKDSLLRWYAEGRSFNKKVVFLLLINLDLFGETERGMLKAKISGYVPTGLNDKRFPTFMDISFELVNANQLRQYGIICKDKESNNS